jgi:hypothetical protein
MSPILFHGEFDGGLPITALRNRAAMYIKRVVQNRSVFKKVKISKASSMMTERLERQTHVIGAKLKTVGQQSVK